MTLDDAGYPEPRHRAAVVQLEAVHEECIPALVHLLRLHAVEPRVFLSQRIRTNRPGLRQRFPELGDCIRFVPLEEPRDWSRLARRVRRYSPDVVVLNTFQNAGPVSWASHFDLPMLGVVHNVTLLEDNELAKQMVEERRIRLLTLAPHVTAHLMRTDPRRYSETATITSTFPRRPRVRPHRSDRRTVAIPGGVNFASRDYRQILDAVPSILESVDPSSIRFTIVGGGGDRQELEEIVAARGYDDLFHFVELNETGFVPGGPYYSHLLGADFLLPLVPPFADAFRTYKITSAIPTSLGLGLPAITDRWTATVYDLPAVTYTDNDIAGGLLRAMTMSADELADLRQQLGVRQEHELARAQRELGFALDRLALG